MANNISHFVWLALVFLLFTSGFSYAATCPCSSSVSCTDALSNASCDLVQLTATLSGSPPLINDPAGFNDKIFDCQGNTLMPSSGGNAQAGIIVNGKHNFTIRNCKFLINPSLGNVMYGGIQITDSVNGTITNNTIYVEKFGIAMTNTSGMNLTFNNFSGVFVDTLYIASGCTHSIDTTNVGAGGKPILYYNDTSNILVENSNAYSLVFLCNVSNGTVRNITTNYVRADGVAISGSKLISIYDNRVNYIRIIGSANSTARNNTVNPAIYGIRISDNSTISTYNITIVGNYVNATSEALIIEGGYSWSSLINASNNSLHAAFPLSVIGHCNHSIDTLNTGNLGKPILYQHDASGVVIENTSAYDNIYFCAVTDSRIRNVTIQNGGSCAITLAMASARNNITDSNLQDVFIGIYGLSSSSFNRIDNNTINSSVSVSIYGVYFYGCTNNAIRYNRMYGGAYSVVLSTSASNNQIYSNNFTRGVQIGAASNNNSVYLNNITSNLYYPDIAIRASSSNNVVRDNVIGTTDPAYSNVESIRIDGSTSNNVTNNTITKRGVGIYLTSSSLNTLAYNNMTNSTYSVFVDGNCNNNINTSNHGAGRPILYVHDTTGITVADAADYSEIYLCAVSNSNVSNFTLTNNFGDGIVLYSGSGNIVSGNLLTNTYNGIYSYYSNQNTIANNSVSNGAANASGILVSYSNGNTLLSNNATNFTNGVKLNWADSSSASGNRIMFSTYGFMLANSTNSTISRNTVTNNTNTGIASPANATSAQSNSTITLNLVCFNAVRDFNSSNWTGSSGANNTCNTPDGWNDTGYSGCRYPCMDSVTPTVTLVAPANGTGFTSSPSSLNWTASDNETPTLYCNVTLNGTVINATIIDSGSTISTPISGLSQGIYWWNVTCADGAGNVGRSQNWVFYVDSTAPNITLLTPLNGTWFNTTSSKNLTWSVTDNLNVSLYCTTYLDGVGIGLTNIQSGGTAIVPTAVLSQGIHRWNVTCNDSANNRAYSANWIFWVDSFAPNVTLVAPPDYSAWSITSLNFTWYVQDNVAAVMSCDYYYDSVLTNSGMSSINNTNTTLSRSGLAQGNHTWYVTCRDNANNSAASATWHFQVDTEPPTGANGSAAITLIAPPDYSAWNVSSLNFTWYTEDNLATTMSCDYYLDSVLNLSNIATPNATATTLIRSGLAQGNHTWSVTCRDDAHNSATSPVWHFQVDTPGDTGDVVISLVSPANGTHYSSGGSKNLVWNVTDDYSTTLNCSVYLNGAAISNISAPNNTNITTATASLASGTYYWNVTCTDNAGNSNVSQTWRFVIATGGGCTGRCGDGICKPECGETQSNCPADCGENQPPTIILLNPPNGATLYTNFAILNFTAKDDRSATLSCTMKVSNGLPNYALLLGNNSVGSKEYSSLSSGTYFWNVTCTDGDGASATSSTWRFILGCGNGVCDNSTGESCSVCEQDCGPCVPQPTCGDGNLTGNEQCEASVACSGQYSGWSCNTTTCMCYPPAPTCGDGTCNGNENCTTCEGDCGKCPVCTRDSDCGQGKVCSSGQCVQGAGCKFSNPPCAECFACSNNVCVELSGAMRIDAPLEAAVNSTVSATMYNSTNGTVGGAYITISGPNGVEERYVTDSRGAISFVPDHVGYYIYSTPCQKNNTKLTVTSVYDPAAPPGMRKLVIDLYVTEPSTMAMDVVDRGSPVNGADVGVLNPSQDTKSGITDYAGSYKDTLLKPGKYVITVSASNVKSLAATISLNPLSVNVQQGPDYMLLILLLLLLILIAAAYLLRDKIIPLISGKRG